MSKTLEFYFDLGSPTSYLAYTQLPALCAQTASELVYHPLLLGGVFKATGNASPIQVPAKARYMLKDLERFAKRYQVPLRFNPHFPINTLPLMRATVGVQRQLPERFIEFLDCMFKALWVDGHNLADPAVLTQVLQSAGFAPDSILQLSEDEGAKAALKANTEQALQRGVFGAPSLFVGDELFFGQDRLDFVRAALA